MRSCALLVPVLVQDRLTPSRMFRRSWVWANAGVRPVRAGFQGVDGVGLPGELGTIRVSGNGRFVSNRHVTAALANDKLQPCCDHGDGVVV